MNRSLKTVSLVFKVSRVVLAEVSKLETLTMNTIKFNMYKLYILELFFSVTFSTKMNSKVVILPEREFPHDDLFRITTLFVSMDFSF